MGRRSRSWLHDERGSSTAEAALVLPTLVLFAVAAAWLVTLGVTHVRAVDAARETARSLARGDGDARALGLGRRVAGAGSAITVHDGDDITVRVTVPVRGPGGAFDFLPRVTVRAEAVAVHEPGTDGALRGGYAVSRCPGRPGPRRPLGLVRRGATQRSERGRDAGSASVLGVQLVAVLAVITLVCVAVAALVLAHRRAQAAADLAALAGATAVQQGRGACLAASRVAGLNHGRLGSCRVDGDQVRVEVHARTAPLLGRVRVLTAEARAGPATPSGPSPTR